MQNHRSKLSEEELRRMQAETGFDVFALHSEFRGGESTQVDGELLESDEVRSEQSSAFCTASERRLELLGMTIYERTLNAWKLTLSRLTSRAFRI